MVHSSPVPNCAPTWEYVAMPLGSSSEAPVIRPGPSFARNPLPGRLLARPGDAEHAADKASSRVEGDLDIHSYLPVSSHQAARCPDDFSTFFASFSTASTAIPLT